MYDALALAVALVLTGCLGLALLSALLSVLLALVILGIGALVPWAWDEE